MELLTHETECLPERGINPPLQVINLLKVVQAVTNISNWTIIVKKPAEINMT